MIHSQSISDLCSLVLHTFNEEKRIVKTLDYYSKLNKKIYLIDNNSTDKTVELASHYDVEIIFHPNSGTTESSEWVSWLLDELPSEYYLFLSCSEEISYHALFSIDSLIKHKIDLCYWRRISYTHNQVSLIFDSFYDLLTFRKKGQYTCRFASQRSLRDNHLNIKIHDNFRLFRDRCSFIEDASPGNCIKHYRPPTDFYVFKKLLCYAKTESDNVSSISKNNQMQANLYLFRCVRELLYLVVLIFSFRLTQIRANELFARIVLHLQIYILITRKNII